jgi:hypothetical protein
VTTRFDRDTEVRRIDAPPGIIAWEGRIDRGWWVARGPNGGYIAAILLRALAGAVEADRAPRSLTIHYTAPPEEGPVRVEARVEHVGRSLSTVSRRMLQGERLLALALAAFSKPRVGPPFGDTPMPDARPPEDCKPFASMIPMHERYDYRLAVGAAPGSGAARRRLLPGGVPLAFRRAGFRGRRWRGVESRRTPARAVATARRDRLNRSGTGGCAWTPTSKNSAPPAIPPGCCGSASG